MKDILQIIPKEAILEGLKEAGRVVWIATFPIIISSFNVTTGEINLNWKLIAVLGIVALLKWIDKTIHEVGKITENTSMIKGLTRF